MTHNCLTNEYDCHGLLKHIYTNTWKFSPYYMYFSFGGIRLSRSSPNTLLVHLDILDSNGTLVLTHSLTFSGQPLKQPPFLAEQCLSRVTSRRHMNFFLTHMHSLVTLKAPYLLTHYYGPYTLNVSLVFALAIFVIRLFLK